MGDATSCRFSSKPVSQPARQSSARRDATSRAAAAAGDPCFPPAHKRIFGQLAIVPTCSGITSLHHSQPPHAVHAGGGSSDGTGGGSGGGGDGDGFSGGSSGADGWDARRIWTLIYALSLIGAAVAPSRNVHLPALARSLASMWPAAQYWQCGIYSNNPYMGRLRFAFVRISHALAGAPSVIA